MSLFVTCGQGLEVLLSEELTELGYKDLSPGYCGVHVKDDSMKSIYNINYRSRLASRVLLPLLDFRCFDQRDLYQKSLGFDWGAYLKKDQTFAIDANVQHESLRNSLFAAQVLKDAICDNLRETHGFRPSVDLKNPDVQLNLYIDQDQAVISFDTSGEPLYKRKYRLESGGAPLQESLAAAFLRIARYNAEDIGIDPCCGSGTLLIEAALLATNTAPGYLRTQWGFFGLPNFKREAWLKVKSDADSQKKPLFPGKLWGLEREPEIAEFCRQNIAKAGFADGIEITCTNFISHAPTAPYNFLISNPPHGKRLGSEDGLRSLYRSLGDFMKQKMAKPGRGYIFTSNTALGKEVGLAAKRRHVITSGGMDARLLEYDLY